MPRSRTSSRLGRDAIRPHHERFYDVYVRPRYTAGPELEMTVRTGKGKIVWHVESSGRPGWKARAREKIANRLFTIPPAITFWLHEKVVERG